MADAGRAVGLASIGLFAGLAADVLANVATHARIDTVPAGMHILSQGDPADRAYALLAGGIRIRQTGSDGAQALMRVIAPGEIFGTVALFTDRRYPADAEAAMGSTVASWADVDLLVLIERYPRIALNVIHIIGERLAEAQERIREMATQSAERRVAHVLLRLADQAGDATTDGAVIRIPLRRRDVAELAGTTLHTASRLLTRWEKDGLIQSRNRILVVRDLCEMRAIACALARNNDPLRGVFRVQSAL